jgi:plasmid stabilization system protein ParE
VVKKYAVKWSARARQNLSSIYYYIKEEQQEPNNADKVREALLSAGRNLSQFPKKHAQEPLLSFTGEPYRSVVVKSSFKIVYLVKDEEVRIVRIFHTKQSPERLKREE